MARRSETTDYIDKQMGLRVRELRKALGYSRIQLAEKIGVSHQQLQKYELGKNRINPGRLWLIAKVFNMKVGDLYEGLEEAGQLLDDDSTLTMLVARNFSRITDKNVRKKLADLIKAVVIE